MSAYFRQLTRFRKIPLESSQPTRITQVLSKYKTPHSERIRRQTDMRSICRQTVRDSLENAELFETSHISGSYRLRRHFPRYCDASTTGSTPVLPSCVHREATASPRSTLCTKILLPAGFLHARDQPLRSHLAELDTADAELDRKSVV